MIKAPELAMTIMRGIEQEGRGGLTMFARAMQVSPERMRKAIDKQEFTGDEIERAKSLRLIPEDS